MRTWEQEQDYKAYKAQEYGAEMDAAIEALDEGRFNDAFMKSFWCMRKRQHNEYMVRFTKKRAQLNPIM